ncbi:hypothetical protein OG914_06690 [Streptomyces sp. NBC_00291]|uniref:hypothetical protein n=1 Tax=Streptomyces sp. NBC_00291 TaxID=2975704 RepID=UPI0022524EE1|nr:hypothetical protein [Streptomyces sp. NBC_00291]MCX5153697.1 hypothetical protein [Streptomyces sp. NBC_00291]
MSLIFETKAALFEQLKALAPAGVQCSWAETGQSDRRQHIWLGATVDEELEPSAMRAGPRKPTTVTGYVDAHAVAISPGNPMTAERSVYALRAVIAEACRGVDRAAVAGLVDVRPESTSVETAETTDGAYSALTVRVKVRGRTTT